MRRRGIRVSATLVVTGLNGSASKREQQVRVVEPLGVVQRFPQARDAALEIPGRLRREPDQRLTQRLKLRA